MTDKYLPQAPVSDDVHARLFEYRFRSDMLWLTQASMAELYDKDVRTINEDLINTIAKCELARSRTIRTFRIVRQEGKRHFTREIEHYKGV